MPASLEKQEYIKNELPYELLKALYNNSRLSLRDLAKQHGVSHHVVSSLLKRLEKDYGIVYTLDLDENKLGFANGKIVTIKFKNKPDIEIIKEKLINDPFVQDLYLADGDFDLIMYVSGITEEEFMPWQWLLRQYFNKYTPLVRISTLTKKYAGFMPLRNKAIMNSPNLSEFEKKVLTILNENSREKISEIAKKVKVKDLDKVIYVIKKLKERGIIKRFTAITTKPGKSIIQAFGATINPSNNHLNYVINFYNEVVKEEKHQFASDYILIIDTLGYFDGFYIASFSRGEDAEKRGAEMYRKIFADEILLLEKAIITDTLVGYLPLHIDSFEVWKKELKLE
ncbi:MAG: winged helix-turn-helix transcriptional regulator [Candidatus Micrarchaeota archaeon]